MIEGRINYLEDRQTGKETEKGREKHQCESETLNGCLLHTFYQGLGLRLGMRPHWELNWKP